MTIMKKIKNILCLYKQFDSKVKKHADFREQHDINFAITRNKIEFNLCDSVPFSYDEMYKVLFILNNLFKVTSLHKKGWDENFIYNLHVAADCSQFMSMFEFSNNIHFSVNPIVHGGYEVVLKHGGGGGFTPALPPPTT